MIITLRLRSARALDTEEPRLGKKLRRKEGPRRLPAWPLEHIAPTLLLHRVFGLLPRFLHLMPRSLGTLLDAAAGLLGDFLCAFCGVLDCYFGFVAGLLSALLCGSAGFIGGLLSAMGSLGGDSLGCFARVLSACLHVGGQVLSQRDG